MDSIKLTGFNARLGQDRSSRDKCGVVSMNRRPSADPVTCGPVPGSPLTAIGRQRGGSRRWPVGPAEDPPWTESQPAVAGICWSLSRTGLKRPSPLRCFPTGLAWIDLHNVAQ